jgi:hypothetical protein
MADRPRIRSRSARTRTPKTERLSRGKATNAPEPEKTSAKILRAKTGSRAPARRGGRKRSPEAPPADGMPLAVQDSAADTAAAPTEPEAPEAGTNQPPGIMPAEAAAGEAPETMPAAQDQDAPPAETELAKTKQAPPSSGAKRGAAAPSGSRSRRRRASPLEAGDADAKAASKARPRANRSDRGGVAAAEQTPAVAEIKTAAADGDASTKRRPRGEAAEPVKAAADSGAARKRRGRQKSSASEEERRKAAEKVQTTTSAGASGLARRPPRDTGTVSRTEPERPAEAAIGDLEAQAALAAARLAETGRDAASTGLPVEGAAEPSITTVTAELAEFAFRSMENGMASLRELSRIRTLPELAEFQARQAQAAVAAWQQHAARMHEIYGAWLKPKPKDRN